VIPPGNFLLEDARDKMEYEMEGDGIEAGKECMDFLSQGMGFLLIIRELSSVYIRPVLADRLDIFVQVGIVFFVRVVARRILSILEFI